MTLIQEPKIKSFETRLFINGKVSIMEVIRLRRSFILSLV